MNEIIKNYKNGILVGILDLNLSFDLSTFSFTTNDPNDNECTNKAS